jgi:hypothetical protein
VISDQSPEKIGLAVVSDGFCRAGVESYFGEGNFRLIFGLAVDIGETFVMVSRENLWCYLSAYVTVYAAHIVVVIAGYVEWILICFVSHVGEHGSNLLL